MSETVRFDGRRLDGKSLFLAVPMYGGNGKADFMNSLLDLQAACAQLSIPLTWRTIKGESLIPRARNWLANEFLKSDATHLLFIDADIKFDPVDVIRCVLADKELIGGPYPMKTIDWRFIREIVLAKPDISPDELRLASCHYHFNYLPGQPLDYDHSQPVEVLNVSTGMMLMDRAVLDTIRAKWPDQTYMSNSDHWARERIYNYFGMTIEDDILLSEDYHFCKRWAEAGGAVWLAPWMKVQHIGDHVYGGEGLEASEAWRRVAGRA